MDSLTQKTDWWLPQERWGKGEIGEGGIISEKVWYLDLGGGYLGEYMCQNALSCTVRSVHFTECPLIKK